MTQPGGELLKGGCGCLVAFLAIGLLFVMCGGSMHIDLGGAILPFVIGGILGLIGYAIFNKGYRRGREDARNAEHPYDDPA
jgi:hypothetical protein